MATDEEESLGMIYGCPHGRTHWGMCPWCTGINEAAARVAKAQAVVDVITDLEEYQVEFPIVDISDQDGDDEAFPIESEWLQTPGLTHDEHIREIALDMAIDVCRGATTTAYTWYANIYVDYAKTFETYIRTGECQE